MVLLEAFAASDHNDQLQKAQTKAAFQIRNVCTAESAQKAQLRKANQSGNALFVLIMINLAVFAFDHFLSQGWVPAVLYLNHSAPRWWQFITCAFCHGTWQHLSSNLVRMR